jgi:hypothetical protein
MDWWALETGAVCPGVPDSSFCWRGVEGHVEHKATRSGRVSFRPLQPGTILRRVAAGGRIFVAVRDTRPGGDVLRLFRGAGAARLASASVDACREHEVWAWAGGPSGWDWDDVRRRLTS